MGIYEELGVKRIINGAATLTAIGGSIMPPEVLESMKEAAQSYVSIIELQHKAGAQIAKWTNNEIIRSCLLILQHLRSGAIFEQVPRYRLSPTRLSFKRFL
jgi:seryl-tRNA(Sec) selenium transferase